MYWGKKFRLNDFKMQNKQHSGLMPHIINALKANLYKAPTQQEWQRGRGICMIQF